MRRHVPTVLVLVAFTLAVSAGAADAVTVTGMQNPQFRVTVTITPNHPVVGDTVVATVKIVNRTRHNHRGEWEVGWSTPELRHQRRSCQSAVPAGCGADRS